MIILAFGFIINAISATDKKSCLSDALNSGRSQAFEACSIYADAGACSAGQDRSAVYVAHGNHAWLVKVSLGAPDFDDFQDQVRAKANKQGYDFEFSYLFNQDGVQRTFLVTDNDSLMSVIDVAKVYNKVLMLQAKVVTHSPTNEPTNMPSKYPTDMPTIIPSRSPTNAFASCHVRAQREENSGVYDIADGGVKAYCNMGIKGANAWTLLMKIDNTEDSQSNPFNYNANHWTQATTLNPNDFDISKGYSKYGLFNTMQCKQFALQWPTWDTGVNTWYITASSKTTALAFFQNQKLIAEGDAVTSRPELNENYLSQQVGFKKFGIALNDGPADKRHGCRWGFSFNNENDAASNDVASGMACQLNHGHGSHHNYGNGDILGCCESKRAECSGKEYKTKGWAEGRICEYRAMLYCSEE